LLNLIISYNISKSLNVPILSGIFPIPSFLDKFLNIKKKKNWIIKNILLIIIIIIKNMILIYIYKWFNLEHFKNGSGKPVIVLLYILLLKRIYYIYIYIL